MTTAPEHQRLEMTRHIRAPRDRVFDAFVSDAALRSWMCPRGMNVPHAKVDARAGGQWQVTILAHNGKRFELGGVFREIRPHQRLVYTFVWRGDSGMAGNQTLVEVDLVERDGATELRMRHSGFSDQAQNDVHREGWTSTLNRLVDKLDERGTAANLVLLGDPRSSYVRTVRMAMAEKGLAYEMQLAPPHSEPLCAVHPFGRMPALRDGEIELWESSAIVRYLDEAFPGGTPLLPNSIVSRARCAQWVSAICDYFYDTMVRRYVLQFVFPRGADGKPDQAVITGALAEIPRQLATLDKAYGRCDWLAGPELSMADLFIAPILAYVEATPGGADMLAAAPNVRRAQAVIRQRRSFAETEPPPA